MQDSDARADDGASNERHLPVSAGAAAYLRDGDRLRPPAQSGITAAWIGGLVVAATGGALAMVGITLPWAMVSPTGSGELRHLVLLTDLRPSGGSLAVVALILTAVGTGLSFASGSRLSSVLRSLTAVLATATAVIYLVHASHFMVGSTVAVRHPVTFGLDTMTVGGTTPSTGCLLYVAGLLMIAMGVGGADRLPPDDGRPVRPGAIDPTLRAARTFAHRLSVAIAVVGAVAATTLPWYRVVPSPLGSDILDPYQPGRADVQVWLVGFRWALVACLALTVLALLLPMAARRLRGIGLVVAASVTTALVLGYMLLWRPLSPFPAQNSSDFAVLRPAAGYHLGVLTMAVLVVGFVLLPAGPSRGIPLDAGPAEPSATPIEPGTGNAAVVAALLAAVDALTNRPDEHGTRPARDPAAGGPGPVPARAERSDPERGPR